MNIKVKKVLISAKCYSKSKKIIKNSKYTYGDAVDFFARVISNSSTRLQAEIKFTTSEIEDLKRKQKRLPLEIIAKENYLEILMEEWKSNRGTYQQDLEENQQLTESINAIKQIAENFHCEPLEIDKYTGNDTISFHARKCGLSLFEFEELITTYEEQ